MSRLNWMYRVAEGFGLVCGAESVNQFDRCIGR